MKTDTRIDNSTAWTGDWVADRLGVVVRTTDAPLGVDIDDLVGLAVRRNPRRAHLLVSTVLGKHVPTDPNVVYGSGLVLGSLAARVLYAPAGAKLPRDAAGGKLLRLALGGSKYASELLALQALDAANVLDEAPVVLGYAETATALGHAVADAVGASTLHSTRRRVPGVTPVGGFEEEHSHATSHLLLPEDTGLLAGTHPLILVDDELSTGTTALNTIAELDAIYPRTHYVIAVLVDLRSDADRVRMAQVASDLGARIDVVALAAGHVDLPEGILAAGQELVAETEAAQAALSAALEEGTVLAPAKVERVCLEAPAGLRDGGRHGFTPADRVALSTYLDEVAAQVHVMTSAAGSSTVHVLGFEELMYTPLLLATKLTRHEATITYSTTTRSPVLAVPDAGYAIRSRLVFGSHDNPDDGPGDRYAYNVAAATATDAPFDTVVLVVDKTGDTPELTARDGLVDQLTRHAGHVVIVTVTDYRPGTTPASTEAISGDTQ